jgi:hypothetical protein
LGEGTTGAVVVGHKVIRVQTELLRIVKCQLEWLVLELNSHSPQGISHE